MIRLFKALDGAHLDRALFGGQRSTEERERRSYPKAVAIHCADDAKAGSSDVGEADADEDR